MTLQPPQRPKTEPLVQACGLTGRMLVVPHRLQVNLICSQEGAFPKSRIRNYGASTSH